MDKKLEYKQLLEKEIIGCMLNDVKNIPSIANKLIKENFSKKYAELFEKIIEQPEVETSEDLIILLMREKIEGISVSDLMEVKEKRIAYDKIESKKILQSFLDLCFSEEAEKLLSNYLKRAKEETTGLDLIEDLKQELGDKIQQVQKFFEEKPFSMNSVIDELEKEVREGDKNTISINCIPSMTYAAGGFKPSNLVGIAGSFKSGKTTLALNIILDIVKQKIPCGFFSLELSESELKRKVAGMFAGISYEHLREPKKLTSDEKQKLIKANHQVNEVPLYISDKLMTENEIYNKSKYWRDRFNIKAICVDYTGYIRSKKRFDSREREVSHYSSFLKQLAKELNIIVVAVAQLNRTGKTNPNVDNLAESISLARDCDFLYITYSPLDVGTKTLNGIQLNETHFVCKMEVSRHSKNMRKEFLLKMKDDGTFIEIATEYEDNYLNKIPSVKPIRNFNEPIEEEIIQKRSYDL